MGCTISTCDPFHEKQVARKQSSSINILKGEKKSTVLYYYLKMSNTNSIIIKFFALVVMTWHTAATKGERDYEKVREVMKIYTIVVRYLLLFSVS